MATSVPHHCVVLSLLGYRDHDFVGLSAIVSPQTQPAEDVSRRIIVGLQPPSVFRSPRGARDAHVAQIVYYSRKHRRSDVSVRTWSDAS